MAMVLTSVTIGAFAVWQGLAPMDHAAIARDGTSLTIYREYPANAPVSGPFPPKGNGARGELAPLPITAKEAVSRYFDLLMDRTLGGATQTVKEWFADFEIERARNRWPAVKEKTFSQILVDDLGCKRGTLDKRKGGKGERLTTITLPDGDIGP